MKGLSFGFKVFMELEQLFGGLYKVVSGIGFDICNVLAMKSAFIVFVLMSKLRWVLGRDNFR
jgi:hypothetical protein